MDRKVYYVCRRGVPRSAMRLDRKPTEEDLGIFAEIGFEEAVVGERYHEVHRAPNGDEYPSTRCWVKDRDGMIVGSFLSD